MVLLVLALIWGALLVSWIRSRSVNTFSDSVGTFRRHLNVLERATPATVRPANRLRVSRPAPRPGPSSVRGTLVSPGPARIGRPDSSMRPLSANAAALRRRQAQRRRRDVFFALLAGVAGTFLLALISRASVVWGLQVIFDITFALYVMLLVRLRNLAAEREMKLRYLPAPRAGRRLAGAYEMAGAYDTGAPGYGELQLRRAAN